MYAIRSYYDKTDIENFKFEAEQAERLGDYGKVAEIRYGKIKEAEAEIERLQKELQEIQGESLIKEEVDSEDIAEVVARWTRITSYNVCYTKLLRVVITVIVWHLILV